MVFVSASKKDEKYDLCDVFGRDKFYYHNSTVRIVAWETPVSILYCDGEEIKIRFKKTIEQFAEGFETKEHECDPLFSGTEFYDILFSNYNHEKPIRCLNYAIEQYKKTAVTFAPVPLTQKELEEKLRNQELLSVAYSLKENSPLFQDDAICQTASCDWFPVDIDAIVTNFSKQAFVPRNEALILFADGRKIYGLVGSDGNFYQVNTFRKDPESSEVYCLNNGIQKCKTSEFLKKSEYGFGYEFLKDYIITPDHLCYNYAGDLLPQKSAHYKNVHFVNELIRLLWKSHPTINPGHLSLELVVPKEFLEFSIDDVENVIVPHLATKNMLNQKARKQFIGVKSILKKVGLERNFEIAFKNIVNLNKFPLYGGSKRNICGEKLLKNLQKLLKKVGTKEMAALLQDEVELKTKMAKINGAVLVEYEVSRDIFMQIKEQQKVPKGLKKDPFWEMLEPGMFVVFSDGSGNRYCVITAKTKAGLGLKRV